MLAFEKSSEYGSST